MAGRAGRLVAAAVILVLMVVVGGPGLDSSAHAAGEDALVRRIDAELAVFTTWLRANGVKGYVGEIGWPDDRAGDGAEWNAVAEHWLRAADAAGLWSTAWSAGEWWGGYALAPYEATRSWTGVDRLSTQASTLEAHRTANGVWRGVNVSGAEFGAPSVEATSTFSNVNRGAYGGAYHYDSQATFTYLASRGVGVVRIPFRWERLQPVRGASLEPNELKRLKDVVARAGVAGLKVILDLHNYGGYYQDVNGSGVRRILGTDKLPRSQFADVWGRISRAFQNNPTVLGYDLMNEPAAMVAVNGVAPARIWERASQEAVSRIRSNLDKKYVFVEGYNWAGAQQWSSQHPVAWIKDGAGKTVYEAHHYWDRDNSGTYTRSYADEVANAASRGY